MDNFGLCWCMANALMLPLSVRYKSLLLILFCKKLTISTSTEVHFTHLLGFNVETVEYKIISFTVWDVGGPEKVF